MYSFSKTSTYFNIYLHRNFFLFLPAKCEIKTMFRRQVHLVQRNIKRQERKKYIMYSAFGWGCPFILSAICGIMDFAPGLLKNLTRPGFGTYNCWFSSK